MVEAKVTATHVTATATTPPPKPAQRDLASDLGELDALCKQHGLSGLAGALAQLIGERFGIRST